MKTNLWERKYILLRILHKECWSHIVPASLMSCLSAIWARRRVMKRGGREAPIRNETSDEGYKLFQMGKHSIASLKQQSQLCDETSLVSVTKFETRLVLCPLKKQAHPLYFMALLVLHPSHLLISSFWLMFLDTGSSPQWPLGLVNVPTSHFACYIRCQF